MLNDFDKMYVFGVLFIEIILKRIVEFIELWFWIVLIVDLEKFREEFIYNNLKLMLLSVNNGIDIFKV